jgi:hypothetical protein
MSSHSEPSKPARPVSPDDVKIPAGVVGTLGVLTAVGVVAFIAALSAGLSQRVWEIFLVNLLFFLGVAQAGVAASAAFYLTQARWAGQVQYRLAEAFVAFLPVGFVLFWGLYIGRIEIFPWILHPIPDKESWLNTPFLFARDGLGLFIITVLSLWFVKASRSEEAMEWTADSANIKMPPRPIRRLAPAIGIAYVLVYTLLAFDLVMSLSPLWRSTLFGWYFFAGAWWSALVVMALIAVLLGRRLPAGNVFSRPNVLHDYGKLVFAFSVFWVYTLFAQYIVIWYGDIPIETFFIVVRDHYMPWMPLSWSAFVLVWVIPFTVLMGARPKRTPAILGTVATLGIIGLWLERYVLVVPSLSPHKVPFGWVEALMTLGFLGLFGLCSLPGMKRVIAAASSTAVGESE